IFSTDDISAKFVKMLKKMSSKFEFKKPSTEELTNFLSGVCSGNNIECEKKALNFIARICDGDVRCALIELNVSSYLTAGAIKYEDISKDNFRDAASDIKKCLKIIFRSKSIDASREVMSKCNEDKGTFLEWVRENIPYEYSKKTDVKKAYEMISNADLFLGRIKATYWRYLIYASVLLSAGVCSAKKEKYDFHSNEFRFPSKIATFARMKFHSNNDAEIIEEFREHCHLSKKKIKDNMAVYRYLYNH
ncbi:MAG: hypothetical protein KAI55_02480, partial [Candidatus Aenigmarchaeota archaeon]|nr:hypothetical protein [Candidatus Aenigmarchaeota archaeon]